MAETEQFERVVATLRQRFPGLRIHVEIEPHPALDADASIPPQSGLDFGVSFNLQGDELHLNVGSSFWVEWFPCSDDEITAEFIDAVVGVLSGRYRIVEYLLGEKPVKAKLQRPVGNEEWKTIATWSTLAAFIPWRHRQNVIQNKAGGPSVVAAGA
jgi:hypothetical protein